MATTPTAMLAHRLGEYRSSYLYYVGRMLASRDSRLFWHYADQAQGYRLLLVKARAELTRRAV